MRYFVKRNADLFTDPRDLLDEVSQYEHVSQLRFHEHFVSGDYPYWWESIELGFLFSDHFFLADVRMRYHGMLDHGDCLRWWEGVIHPNLGYPRHYSITPDGRTVIPIEGK